LYVAEKAKEYMNSQSFVKSDSGSNGPVDTAELAQKIADQIKSVIKPKVKSAQSKKKRNRKPGIYDVAVKEYLCTLDKVVKNVHAINEGADESELAPDLREIIHYLEEREKENGKNRYEILLDMLKQKNIVAYLKVNNLDFKEKGIDSIDKGVTRAFEKNNGALKKKCGEIEMSIMGTPLRADKPSDDQNNDESDGQDHIEFGGRDDDEYSRVQRHIENLEQPVEEYLVSLHEQFLTGSITREEFSSKVYDLKPSTVAEYLRKNVEPFKGKEEVVTLSKYISKTTAWKDREAILNLDQYGIKIEYEKYDMIDNDCGTDYKP